jgi:hypothetical protein
VWGKSSATGRGAMSRFRFETGRSDCKVVSGSVFIMSLSFSVLDRFLGLVNSASVDCGVGVCRACVGEVDEEAKAKGFSFGFPVAEVLKFCPDKRSGNWRGCFGRNADKRTG